MRTWSFSNGKWREGETVGAEFTWYDVTGAKNAGLSQLAERYSLHPLAIEDCLSTNLHAPKVDDFGDHLFIVLHAVVDPEDGADTEEADIFLGHNFLITYQDDPSGTSDSEGRTPADAVIAALANGIAIRPGPDGLLYEIADRLVDDILPSVNALSEELDTLQDEVMLKSNAGTRHRQILASRARAGRIRRILTSQLAVMQRLSRGEFALISEPNRIYFRDIYDHLVRIDLALEGLREDAEVALSTYLSAVNNRLSEVMKVLAVVSALMLPGTLITGVFGTNFDNVPGLHSNWGFLIMIVSMAAIAVGMAIFFRRRRWF